MTISHDVFTSLRACYLENLSSRLDTIRVVRRRLEAGDSTAATDARSIGHQCSGTGASFGMPEVSIAGRAVEQARDDVLAMALAGLMDTIRSMLSRELGSA